MKQQVWVGIFLCVVLVAACKTFTSSSSLSAVVDYMQDGGQVVLRVRSDILELPPTPEIGAVSDTLWEPLGDATKLYKYKGVTKVDYSAKVKKIDYSLFDNPDFIQLGVDAPVSVQLDYYPSLKVDILKRYKANSPSIIPLESQVTALFRNFAIIGVDNGNKLTSGKGNTRYRTEITNIRLKNQNALNAYNESTELTAPGGVPILNPGLITKERRVRLPVLGRPLRRLGRRLLRVNEAQVQEGQTRNGYVVKRPAAQAVQRIAQNQAAKQSDAIKQEIQEMYNQNIGRIQTEVRDLGSKEFNKELDAGIFYILQVVEDYLFKDLRNFFDKKKFFASSTQNYMQLAIGSKPLHVPGDKISNAIELYIHENYINELVAEVVPAGQPVHLPSLIQNLKKLPTGIDLGSISEQVTEIQKELNALKKQSVYNLRFASPGLSVEFSDSDSMSCRLNLVAEYKPVGKNALAIKNDQIKIGVKINLRLKLVWLPDRSIQLVAVMEGSRPVRIHILEKVIPSANAGSSVTSTAINVGYRGIASLFAGESVEDQEGDASSENEKPPKEVQEFIDEEVSKVIAQKEKEIQSLLTGGLEELAKHRSSTNFAIPEFGFDPEFRVSYVYKPSSFKVQGKLAVVGWSIFHVQSGMPYRSLSGSVNSSVNGSASPLPQSLQSPQSLQLPGRYGTCECKVIAGNDCSLQKSRSGQLPLIVMAQQMSASSGYNTSSGQSAAELCRAQGCGKMYAVQEVKNRCR